jgi:hypothetical protein
MGIMISFFAIEDLDQERVIIGCCMLLAAMCDPQERRFLSAPIW